MKQQLLIQKSMMRSGGTILRLILGEIFNNSKCFKNYEYRWPIINTHGYENITSLNPYLITAWRDPRDVAVSLMRIAKHPYSDDLKLQEVSNNIMGMFNNIRKVENENDNKLILKYENFHNDFDFLFNILETTFNGVIDNELRNGIKHNFSKESVKKYQSQFKDFSEYNPNNHIHGDHVSTGLSKWKDIFTSSQVEVLNDKLSPAINYWNNII